CIQAMADGGVKMGLSRTDAVLLAAQTLLGAAHMVMETGQDPITLRNMVTSPGGSTIAAIHKLESHGFSGALMDAVEEATHVTERLGKNK
ncbi:MAG: pyrroline-5-carboxylate reductase dimerization domain-containing protein, partial [Spirochaetota bacterium]